MLPSRSNAEVHELPRLTPIGLLQSRLEDQMTASIKLATASFFRGVDLRLLDSLGLSKTPILTSSGRRLVGSPVYSHVRTFFGAFWCVSAKYRSSSRSNSQSQRHFQNTDHEIKTETIFGFVPSRWLIELGVHYAIQASSQGWRKPFRVFNIWLVLFSYFDTNGVARLFPETRKSFGIAVKAI